MFSTIAPFVKIVDAWHPQNVPPQQLSGHNVQKPIYEEKLKSGEGQWAVRKEVLGWMVDGSIWCIELTQDNQTAFDAELQNIV